MEQTTYSIKVYKRLSVNLKRGINDPSICTLSHAVDLGGRGGDNVVLGEGYVRGVVVGLREYFYHFSTSPLGLFCHH